VYVIIENLFRPCEAHREYCDLKVSVIIENLFRPCKAHREY